MKIVDVELRSAVEELRKLKLMKSDLEDMISDQEQLIIDYMVQHKLETKVGEDFKITYKESGKSFIDQSLLVPILGEDLSKYKKTTKFKRLMVR